MGIVAVVLSVVALTVSIVTWIVMYKFITKLSHRFNQAAKILQDV